MLIGGGRSKRAEVYPNELCKEIIIGLRDQMLTDGRLGGEGMIGAVDAIDEVKLNLKDYNDVDFMMTCPASHYQRG